jgi:hypothetical protein
MDGGESMRSRLSKVLFLTALFVLRLPPQYAVGSIPSSYERITKLEMTWKVGEKPKTSTAFFSPWFGMDPADNLNLIQPVNPWSRTAWSMYTEYYQWSPTHNSNSRSYSASAGDVLTGSLVYNATIDSYTLTQTNTNTGDVSSQVVACQDGKEYTVPYVVYEKTFACADYPPDEVRRRGRMGGGGRKEGTESFGSAGARRGLFSQGRGLIGDAVQSSWTVPGRDWDSTESERRRRRHGRAVPSDEKARRSIRTRRRRRLTRETTPPPLSPERHLLRHRARVRRRGLRRRGARADGVGRPPAAAGG